MRALNLCLIACLSFPTIAKDHQGWRWYNEPRPVKPIPKPVLIPATPHINISTTPAQTPKPRQRTMSATEQMQWFHGYMAEVQNDAVINSTDVDKVTKFMKVSQFIEGKTTEFGMSWKKALLLDPSLDYRVENPTESLAAQTQNSLSREKKIQAVKDLKEKGFGLFFVYDSTEPLDKVLAPSIQAFSEQYDIDLLGISLDGEFLEEIKSNRKNNNTIPIDTSPALLLVHPQTQEMYPLAYGFISQEELLGRFLNVATEYAPNF
ncbi:type-F conjugative transfer system pilin assembly protein TraF [Aliivibrio fischeri]|uniref:Type-F conjugative transfer system pilin assembly protein TraF n=1 Tax=Aliivibrio fischeri TaxID=668 RepID=A0A844P6M2_ALIFS|nr:type-F conjugative transfer system pilin assembly protein TraF [Aliivibrio fischeri]MUK51139.1 type-F conjugative transfer system pilin assembly protein TraF [Aliivibrio fischeri]